MAEKEPVALDALNGLLKERQRYEEWLKALEGKRAATPESVYLRVQTDYQNRLNDVSGKLAERAGELRASIDGMTGRLNEIRGQETQQREARQEAELRAAVGEYTDKQWKEIGGAWDKELGRLAKERGTVEAQLNELTRIFTLSTKDGDAPISSPASPPAAEPAPAPRPQQSAVPLSARMIGGNRTGAIGNQPPPPPPASAYVAEALNPSAQTPISPVVPRAAVPEPPTLTAPARPAEPSRVPPGGSPGPAPAKSPFDEFPVLRPGASAPSPARTSSAVATPPGVPRSGGTQDPRSEQHKTLKCPECAASNYPTEWYCERCGGELATM